MLKLYTYWRSSAAYRVRIALALKGQPFDSHAVHLVRDGGEQHSADYQAINPQKLLPAVQLESDDVLTQSLAILEYLDEAYPAPALLPLDLIDRAKVRAMAYTVAMDIHPLNNLRVLNFITNTLGQDQDLKSEWCQRWIDEGFEALETLITSSSKPSDFCFGDTPSLADICLVPQIYNARRFGVDMTAYPNLSRIEKNCLALPAFDQARPENQSDAQPVT